jgi:hypothetical protein
MTRSLRLVCPLLSVGLLAFAFFFGGLKWPAAGMLGFGVLWMVGLRISWKWVPHVGLYVTFMAAALGFFLGFSPVFLIPSALLALVAWDLSGFQDRLSLAAPDDNVIDLEKRHLTRLSALVVAGLGVSVFALSLHLKSPFEWMIILVFFTVWALGRVVGLLIKRDQ